MDKSKIFQPNHEYNLEDGILNVNTFNGRILYSYPIASIGKGNFQIDVNLIYNSLYGENNNSGIKLGFGNGWKFSFEEFIFKYENVYNLEGFSSLDYVYVDSNWCLHRFIKYKECEGYDTPGSVYYDESGTGLKLIVSKDSNYQMFDEHGSIYYFDKVSGKLITIISGINSLIIKNIEYDETREKVLSVYDSRKSDKRLKFDYNQNNLPIKVYSTASNIFHTFEYDANNLICIFKENGSQKKKIHEFWYKDSLISCIINSENLQALRLEYVQNNSNFVLNKISFGAMKEKITTADNAAEVYCGDNSYCGEEYYTNSRGKKYIKSNLIMPNEYVYSTITYDYKLSYTEETNHKGIKMRYYFDIDGNCISNLEYNNSLTDIYHYTSAKPIGWEVAIEGDSSSYINDKRAKTIYKDNNKYIYFINNNDLVTFKNIFLDEKEKTSEHFSLSFWLMFNNSNDSDLLAKVKYTINDEITGEDNIKESQVIIKNTLGGAWQYVSAPLNLGTTQSTLKNISIEFDADVELALDNDQIQIADVRINKGNNQTICIDNLKLNDKSYIELEIGKKLYYYDSYEREVTLSPKFYMTESDIIATYRSLYYSIKNNDLYYELFYCNKTKIKSVTYVSMLPFFLTDDLETRNNHKYYTFDFAVYIDEQNKQKSDTPNYHFRYIDLIAVQEDKKSYRVSEIQRKIKERENNRFSFETYTLIGVVEDYNAVQRLDETNSVCNVIEENDDGTEIKKKYIKRIFDDNNEVEKEINIISENVYDSFGNISKVITKANGSTTEQLIREYTYYENDAEKIEYTKEIKENGNIVISEYNDKGNVNNIIVKYNKKFIDGDTILETDLKANRIEYLYDGFDNLVGLKFYDKNDNLIGENKIDYNKNGNLSKLNNRSGVSYGFIYNAYSELCEIYRNKNLLQKELNELTKTFDKYKSYLYHGNISYLTTDVYDEFNRIISSSVDNIIKDKNENVQKILFEYEDYCSKFSKSLERIKRITDSFNNKTYTFEYEDSVSDGTTKKMIESNNYSITTKPNGAKIYYIPNDLKEFKYVSEKEDQINNNPKNSYNYTKVKDSNDWEEIIYNSFDYEYDDLGRLICKKEKPDEYANATITINKNISYYENTNFPKEIKYNVNSKLKNSENTEVNGDIIYENSYIKGNIINVKESGHRFIQNPKNNSSQGTISLETRTTDYEYDDNDRLVKETTNGNTLFYTYGETSGMIEKVSKDINENVIKTFEYKFGKLTKANGYDIMYDNYGNIIKYNGVEIGYNFRNLIEKYENINDTYLFEYNYSGVRTKKIKCNEYEVNYYLDGTKIIGEDVIDLKTNKIIRKFRYFYDIAGVCGINYIIDDVDHYFNLIKDSLGNISKVMYRGKIIGEYTYDAWGNCSIKIFDDTNPNEIDKYIVNNNPFRFKGYYCDLETNLYYCQFRYYDPFIYQWLSPDSIDYLDYENILGINLYSYSDNNPVNKYDPTGHFTILALVISIGVSILFEVVEDAIDGGLGDDSHDWKDYLGAGISGFFGGLSGGLGAQLVFSIAGGFADAALSGDLEENGIMNTLASSILSFGISSVASGLTNRIASGVKASSLKRISKKFGNNAANKKLGKIGAKIKIGSKAAKKTGGLAKAIMEDSKWIGNIISDKLSGSIFGGATSMGYDYLVDKFGLFI